VAGYHGTLALTGMEVFVVVPLPNWPIEFLPQQYI